MGIYRRFDLGAYETLSSFNFPVDTRRVEYYRFQGTKQRCRIKMDAKWDRLIFEIYAPNI